MTKQYRTVKLPSKMLESIELLIRDHPELGYTASQILLRMPLGFTTLDAFVE